MLGQLPLFLCKPLRYQVSKQFTFYHSFFVCFIHHAPQLIEPCPNCSRTIIWKQQRWGEKLGPATQTQSLLLDYNRNPSFIEAAGNLTFKQMHIQSRPVILWVFCLWLKPSLPASHGPLLSQTKPSSQMTFQIGQQNQNIYSKYSKYHVNFPPSMLADETWTKLRTQVGVKVGNLHPISKTQPLLYRLLVRIHLEFQFSFRENKKWFRLQQTPLRSAFSYLNTFSECLYNANLVIQSTRH